MGKRVSVWCVGVCMYLCVYASACVFVYARSVRVFCVYLGVYSCERACVRVCVCACVRVCVCACVRVRSNVCVARSNVCVFRFQSRKLIRGKDDPCCNQASISPTSWGKAQTRGQFHQRSTRSFYASSLTPVEYKAKM